MTALPPPIPGLAAERSAPKGGNRGGQLGYGKQNSRYGNLGRRFAWQHVQVIDDQLGEPSGHVIVCGLQGVGLRTVEQFHFSGTTVVVVDDDADPRFARILSQWGVHHIQRSAHLGEGLDEAGIDRAIAVVCTELDEIHTLETALRVRELRPDVRVVVQLGNPSVAKALELVSGEGSVLDVASLAAPSFVEACLGRRAHDIELAGVEFAVAQAEVPPLPGAHDTFRGHYGNLAPVAIMPRDGGEMAQCPGRDHRVESGDRVAVFGTVDELAQHGIDVAKSLDGPRRKLHLIERLSRQASVALDDDNKAFVLVIAGLLALLVISAVIIHFAYRVPNGQGHLNLLTSISSRSKQPPRSATATTPSRRRIRR